MLCYSEEERIAIHESDQAHKIHCPYLVLEHLVEGEDVLLVAVVAQVGVLDATVRHRAHRRRDLLLG